MNRIDRATIELQYSQRMTKLQRHWKNPVDSNWDFSDWSDEELSKGLKDITGQLRFEIATSVLKWIFYIVIPITVVIYILFFNK